MQASELVSLDEACGYVNGQGNSLYCNPDLEIARAGCSNNGKCGQFLRETEQLAML